MKTLAVSILLLLGAFGCASEEPANQMAPDTAHPTGIAFDPVTHVEVTTDSPWKTYSKGYWYYFESQENQLRFQVDPDKYVAPQERTLRERNKVYPYQVP